MNDYEISAFAVLNRSTYKELLKFLNKLPHKKVKNLLPTIEHDVFIHGKTKEIIHKEVEDLVENMDELNIAKIEGGGLLHD